MRTQLVLVPVKMYLLPLKISDYIVILTLHTKTIFCDHKSGVSVRFPEEIGSSTHSWVRVLSVPTAFESKLLSLI